MLFYLVIGLEADHTVHMVRGFVPPASANSGGATYSVGPNTSQGNPSSVEQIEDVQLGGSSFGANLFPGLGLGGMGEGGGLFGAGLPDIEQMQQQLTRNPDIMRDIMNRPVVQNLMNNPVVMWNLIVNSP